ncbi:MAG: carboxypeptidase regulatory-like domain-containing protein [Gemmatimonadetes bacterium]|nr:carboxypeptidase regulatory-like domain-containing protein [Gemmatimonadota bacterium]
MRVSGKDTVLVAGAKVWTDPFTQDAVSDSGGYFSIREGIVPGQYRVLAELEGVKGRTQRLGFALGQSATRVVVLLGAEETEWPPPGRLEQKLPTSTKGTGGTRGVRTCCNP